MVDVVELADRGHAGAQHLFEGLQADLEEAVGVEAFDQAVHGFAPGPEGAGSLREGFAAASQESLEGVGMGVDEAGEERPFLEPPGRSLAQPAADPDDPFAFDLDLDSPFEGLPGVGEVRFDQLFHFGSQAPGQAQKASTMPASSFEARSNSAFGSHSFGLWATPMSPGPQGGR